MSIKARLNVAHYQYPVYITMTYDEGEIVNPFIQVTLLSEDGTQLNQVGLKIPLTKAQENSLKKAIDKAIVDELEEDAELTEFGKPKKPKKAEKTKKFGKFKK